MTPGIHLLRKRGITHKVYEYKHDPSAESYGLEAAEKLNLAHNRVLKTLVVCLDNNSLVVAIVPVATKLSMKQIAKSAGTKKASMAPPADVERSTGYVLGGVSPLGQKKRLRTYIDESAKRLSTVFISAGRRGLEIELSPQDLAAVLGATFVPLCQ